MNDEKKYPTLEEVIRQLADLIEEAQREGQREQEEEV